MSTGCRIVLVCGAIVLAILMATAYLLTLGHCFLPLSGLAYPGTEVVEVREYESFGVPWMSATRKPNRIRDAITKAVWTLRYPGRAQLCAVTDRLSTTKPYYQQLMLHDGLKAMGYPLAPGCGSGVPDVQPGWRVTNYPSVLDRIEKDLKLERLRYRPVYDFQGKLLNPQGGASGRQPSTSDTNRMSAAAASRRSP